MIISYYGKKFLKKYNEIEKKNLSVEEFFVKIFYPLFFGTEKALMFVTNSPFNQQNPIAKENRKTKKGRDIILEEFKEKIRNGETDGCVFVGGGAKGFVSSTSFNIATEYNHLIDEDEVFYSWIGQALSLQFKGVNMLFDNDKILYDTYLGWKRYAKLLSEPLYEKYKGSQISTWNTLWINDQYSTKGKSAKFNPFDQSKDKLMSISWVRVLFNIASKHSNTNINVYAYRFGQTNETYGLVPIELKKIEGFLMFCYEYFGKNNFLTRPDLYETILGTGYSMEKICELGSLGMLALKPELLKLEEYRNKSADVERRIRNHYKKAIEDDFKFKIYNTYLMTTLNSKDIQKDVIEIATALYNFETDTRKNSKILVEELLSTTNQTGFLKAVNKMMDVCVEENLSQHVEMLQKLVGLATSDESKLINLMLLIRFNHGIITHRNKK